MIQSNVKAQESQDVLKAFARESDSARRRANMMPRAVYWRLPGQQQWARQHKQENEAPIKEYYIIRGSKTAWLALNLSTGS